MTIFLNLENVDRRLTDKIIKELEAEFFPNDNNLTNYFKLVYHESASTVEDSRLREDNRASIRGIELDEKDKQLDLVKQKVKDILVKIAIDNYVVTLDPHSLNEIVILKRSEAESTGALHCRHCGMEFEDQIQLGNHLRIHYMI